MDHEENNSVFMNMNVKSTEKAENPSLNSSSTSETEALEPKLPKSNATSNVKQKSRGIIVRCSGTFGGKIEITVDLINNHASELLKTDGAASNKTCWNKSEPGGLASNHNKCSRSKSPMKSASHFPVCFSVGEDKDPAEFNRLINFLKLKYKTFARKDSKRNIDCLPTSEVSPAKRFASNLSQKTEKLKVDFPTFDDKPKTGDFQPTDSVPQTKGLNFANVVAQADDLPQHGDLPQSDDLPQAHNLPQIIVTPPTVNLPQICVESTNSELPPKSFLPEFSGNACFKSSTENYLTRDSVIRCAKNNSLKSVSASTQTDEYKCLTTTELKKDQLPANPETELVETTVHDENQPKQEKIDNIFQLINDLTIDLTELNIFLQGQPAAFVSLEGELPCISQGLGVNERRLAYIPEQFKNDAYSRTAKISLRQISKWDKKLKEEAVKHYCYYADEDADGYEYEYADEDADGYEYEYADEDADGYEYKYADEDADAHSVKDEATSTISYNTPSTSISSEISETPDVSYNTPTTSISNEVSEIEFVLSEKYPSRYKSYSSKGKASEKYPAKGKASEKYPAKGKASEKYPAKGKSFDNFTSTSKSKKGLQQKDGSTEGVQSKDGSNDGVQTKDKLTDGVQTKDKSTDGVHSKDESANEVQPKDGSANVVQPKDGPANGVQPKDESANEVQPKDESANEVQPKDGSANGVQPKDGSVNGVQPKEGSSAGVQPKGGLSDDLKTNDSPSDLFQIEDSSSDGVQRKDNISDREQSKYKSSRVVQPKNKPCDEVQLKEKFINGMQPEDKSSRAESSKVEPTDIAPSKSELCETAPLSAEIKVPEIVSKAKLLLLNQRLAMVKSIRTIRDELNANNRENKQKLSDIIEIIEIVYNGCSQIRDDTVLEELLAHVPEILNVLKGTAKLRDKITVLLMRLNSLSKKTAKADEVRLILKIKDYVAEELTLLTNDFLEICTHLREFVEDL